MQIDDSGNKPALVHRLMAALSTAQPVVQTVEKQVTHALNKEQEDCT